MTSQGKVFGSFMRALLRESSTLMLGVRGPCSCGCCPKGAVTVETVGGEVKLTSHAEVEVTIGAMRKAAESLWGPP